MKISKLFTDFFHSEKSGGFLLIFAALIALILANSGWGDAFIHLLHKPFDLSFAGLHLNHTTEEWVNDGFMTIFFLLVGLEIERELYVGELSAFKNAILPVLAAIGGMLFPALIHFAFNTGLSTQSGFGIPMATDIAFALGILSLAGKHIPVSLKIFLTALAIMDDLGAIAVIGIFYSKGFAAGYFFAAMGIFALLYMLGKFKVFNLAIYLAGGIVMWYCMMQSGIHATIAGVLLAFAIPFIGGDEKKNPSYRLQHFLHRPVAFIILPVFALVNTAIIIPDNMLQGLKSPNSLGIICGLLIGKLLGILLVCFIAVRSGIATLPMGVNWRHLTGMSLLAGIGFTMSIFITNLAFTDPAIVITSKISILIASVFAAIAGLLVLRTMRKTAQG